jgi:hypothetical protein
MHIVISFHLKKIIIIKEPSKKEPERRKKTSILP